MIVGIVAVFGAGYYLWSKKDSFWSNASGGTGGTPQNRPRCAIYANPNGTYSHTGSGEAPHVGAKCVSNYAF